MVDTKGPIIRQLQSLSNTLHLNFYKNIVLFFYFIVYDFNFLIFFLVEFSDEKLIFFYPLQYLKEILYE